MIRSSLGELGDDWQGESWTRPLLDQLAATGGDDAAVQAVVQGWMRIGGTGTPSDAVFVLGHGQLGFASAQVTLSDHWVTFAEIEALDLLEGLPYPGPAIEVRLTGDRAMLVGWPEWFSDRVVTALRGHRDGLAGQSAEAPVAMPVVADGDVEMARLEDLAPSAFTEPEVEVAAEPEPAVPVDEPAAVAEIAEPEPEVVEAADDTVVDDTVVDDTVEVGLAHDAAMDEFFESPPPVRGDGDDRPDATTWPAPFTGVGYHGGADSAARRRKNLTLVFSTDGASAVAAGFGKWSLHLGRDEIRTVTVQGPDEIMFTYGVRIDSESAAIVVGLDDDVAIFEIPERSPIALRHDLAAVRF